MAESNCNVGNRTADSFSSNEKSAEEIKALIQKITAAESENDDVMRKYKSWADTYAQDLKRVGYQAPSMVLDCFLRWVKGPKDIRILDLAAGTGMLGEHLIQAGYRNVDAIDGSQAMLDKAKEKSIYKKYICSLVGANRLAIDDDTYHAIVTCGSFCPGHLNHKCFPELIRITEPGGYIFIVMRQQYVAESAFFSGFEEAIKLHEESGKWKLVERNNSGRVGEFHKEDTAISLVFQICKT